MVGHANGGEAIHLDYVPLKNGNPGHWKPFGSVTDSTDKNNCLFDSVAATVKNGSSGPELRKIVDR